MKNKAKFNSDDYNFFIVICYQSGEEEILCGFKYSNDATYMFQRYMEYSYNNCIMRVISINNNLVYMEHKFE